MQKLQVAQAAEILGISKEAVYNRMRRNTINFIEEDGVKFVIIDDKNDEAKPIKTQIKSEKTTTQNNTMKNEFVEYLIKEIEELKEKIEILQHDKEQLFREKEEILLTSKEEIKSMYKERDEKLGYFLSFFDKPLITSDSKPFDVIAKDEILDPLEWLSVSKFIKNLNLKRKKRMKIQNILIENIGKNEFIKVINDELLINKNLDIKTLKKEN